MTSQEEGLFLGDVITGIIKALATIIHILIIAQNMYIKKLTLNLILTEDIDTRKGVTIAQMHCHTSPTNVETTHQASKATLQIKRHL